MKDSNFKEPVKYLGEDKLPKDPENSRKPVAKVSQFNLINSIMFYVNTKHGYRRRVVVPHHLREQLLRESTVATLLASSCATH